MPARKRTHSSTRRRAVSANRRSSSQRLTRVEATNDFISGNIHWFFKTLGFLIAILTFLVVLLAILVVLEGS